MTWYNPRFLVVSGRVPCQLQDLGCKVFHYSCLIHRRSWSDSVVMCNLSEISVNTADRKLESCFSRSWNGFGPLRGFSPSSRHFDCSFDQTYSQVKKILAAIMDRCVVAVNQYRLVQSERGQAFFSTPNMEHGVCSSAWPCFDFSYWAFFKGSKITFLRHYDQPLNIWSPECH